MPKSQLVKNSEQKSQDYLTEKTCDGYGKPIVAIFNNLIYVQFSIYIYVIFFIHSI